MSVDIAGGDHVTRGFHGLFSVKYTTGAGLVALHAYFFIEVTIPPQSSASFLGWYWQQSLGGLAGGTIQLERVVVASGQRAKQAEYLRSERLLPPSEPACRRRSAWLSRHNASSMRGKKKTFPPAEQSCESHASPVRCSHTECSVGERCPPRPPPRHTSIPTSLPLSLPCGGKRLDALPSSPSPALALWKSLLFP